MISSSVSSQVFGPLAKGDTFVLYNTATGEFPGNTFLYLADASSLDHEPEITVRPTMPCAGTGAFYVCSYVVASHIRLCHSTAPIRSAVYLRTWLTRVPPCRVCAGRSKSTQRVRLEEFTCTILSAA